MRATLEFFRYTTRRSGGPRWSWRFSINGRPIAKDDSPRGYARRRAAVRGFHRFIGRVQVRRFGNRAPRYKVTGLD